MIPNQDLTQLHNKLLKLLVEFDKLCNENNLKYSVSDGTLLGAIRHKGFIPWDDDVDVLMERDEFEQLKKLQNQEFEIENVLWIPRIKFKNREINPNGIFIDIMVFDKAPISDFKHKLKVFALRFLQGTLKENIEWGKYSLKGKFLLLPTVLVGKLLKKNTLLNWYEKISTIDNKQVSKNLCCYKNTYRSLSKQLSVDYFSSYEYLDFEDVRIKGIVGWHDYLTKYYGDYMTPPKKDEQMPKHDNLSKI